MGCEKIWDKKATYKLRLNASLRKEPIQALKAIKRLIHIYSWIGSSLDGLREDLKYI